MEMQVLMGVRMEPNAGRLLVGGSWFVGLDLGPEAFVVGDVVDFPVNAFLVDEAVAALDVAVSVARFLSVLLAMVVLHVVAKVVGLGLVMLEGKMKLS